MQRAMNIKHSWSRFLALLLLGGLFNLGHATLAAAQPSIASLKQKEAAKHGVSPDEVTISNVRLVRRWENALGVNEEWAYDITIREAAGAFAPKKSNLPHLPQFDMEDFAFDLLATVPSTDTVNNSNGEETYAQALPSDEATEPYDLDAAEAEMQAAAAAVDEMKSRYYGRKNNLLLGAGIAFVILCIFSAAIVFFAQMKLRHRTGGNTAA